MSVEQNTSESRSNIPDQGVSENLQQSEIMAGFPIIGIGASAGGLAAFKSFFAGFAPDTHLNMAFVLVQHLAPDHSSILAELIRTFTTRAVFEVEDGMQVRPNCVYVIPPNHEMAILNGRLSLLPCNEPRTQRLPIDFFLNSLAQDQRQFAIAIILSGNGSDGAQGIRAIKSEGGMVMVQSPESTEFDGMPRSAIKTGIVDFVCEVDQMPTRLTEFAARAYRGNQRIPPKRTPEVESAIQKIFVMLRARTGHDFSLYKPNTVDRRIERRMLVNQVDSLDEYLKRLQKNPNEIEALFHDLLIGVTHFFRDPEAFEKLEKQLSTLISEKSAAGSRIRVWVGGCSTGEEAYSIAILVHEQLETLQSEQAATFGAQVFASDMDARAIAIARAGLYPKSISEFITPTRLARFFTYEPDTESYRISKRIREMVIFSEHDVNKDPPFSKLDLISCRNLMIYLGSELQRRLIPLFHFALNPNGLLFLGSSEGIGDFEQLFTTVDRKAKLYRRKPDFEGMQRVRLPRASSSIFPTLEVAAPNAKAAVPVKLPMRELAEQTILSLLSPAAALVNAKGDILYLLGRTGSFLEPTAGESAINNILKMAREGLRHQLTTALHKVATTQVPVHLSDLLVKTNGHFAQVDVSICPAYKPRAATLSQLNDGLYLVLMKEVLPSSSAKLPEVDDSPELLEAPIQSTIVTRDSEALIESLNAELQAKEEYLQSAYEELESANEELKSSNEEMQSVNEELQSTNEELETSKEELQSINEELSTINSELQSKVADLSRLNNDMNNLLAGSGVATIFVDQKLCILRFTPAMAQIINLIASDVGRPVAHIVSNLIGYSDLIDDASTVLETLVPQERQVQTSAGQWFHMRIKPYRTIDNVIEGVVITFVDITDLKRSEDMLERANRQMRLAIVARDSCDAITVHDLDGRIIAWNPAATKLYGWSEEEALQLNVRDRIPPRLLAEWLSLASSLGRAEILEPFKSERLTKSGDVLNVRILATALVNEAGLAYAVATTERLEN